eukprot:NODE_1508_length_880_cov_231.351384_g1167_i0.p1 GENE.NODE_1508_length_880_cov_231.351384_g1167_i0~~NODE_1508_length_880_cov_231.351384_g1167_i0.p1  ORF type:complete len:166 (-),score=42.49 NODE_1508_length_880_cov_231.351384_g1167_i0:101-598(-)
MGHFLSVYFFFAMKSFILCLLVALVAARPITVKWAKCSNFGRLNNIDVNWTPNPSTGMNVTITGTGNLPAPAMSSGAWSLLVKQNGVPIAKKDHDFCSPDQVNLPLGLGSLYLPGVQCPVAAGPIVVNMYVSVASAAPSGVTTAELSAKDQANNRIFCIDVTMTS